MKAETTWLRPPVHIEIENLVKLKIYLTSVMDKPKESTHNSDNDIISLEHVLFFLSNANGSYPEEFQRKSKSQQRSLQRYAEKFRVEEGDKMYYIGVKQLQHRLVVFSDERKRDIFKMSHDSDIGGHQGQKRTILKIGSRFYWRGMTRDIHSWVSIFSLCLMVQVGSLVAHVDL